MYVERTEATPMTWSHPVDTRPKRRRQKLPTLPRMPYEAGGGATPPGGSDDPVLPRCPHCGSIPLRCKQPQDCKWEDVQKS